MSETYYYVAYTQGEGENRRISFVIVSDEKTSEIRRSMFIGGKRYYRRFNIDSPEGLAQLLYEHNDELVGRTEIINGIPEGFTTVKISKRKEDFPRPLNFEEKEELDFHASRLYPDLSKKLQKN
jgi:hypothetical protein